MLKVNSTASRIEVIEGTAAGFVLDKRGGERLRRSLLMEEGRERGLDRERESKRR